MIPDRVLAAMKGKEELNAPFRTVDAQTQTEIGSSMAPIVNFAPLLLGLAFGIALFVFVLVTLLHKKASEKGNKTEVSGACKEDDAEVKVGSQRNDV